MNLTLKSSSVEQTLEIAGNLAKKLKGDELILFYGDLGAGKTVFIKGIVEFFGVNKSEVVSPTFTLLNEYKTTNFNIYHFDLYRIGESVSEYFYEIDDLLGEGLILVEWSEYLSDYYKSLKSTINIKISIESNERIISIYTSLL